MSHSAMILFGAVFTVATCIACGVLWLRIAPVPLVRMERWLFSFLCGAAVLSGIVFLLCWMHLARRGVLGAIGIAAIAAAVSLRGDGLSNTLPRPSGMWRLVFATAFAVFGVVYFFNAMAPEMSPDGMAYHLWLPQAYLRARGFVRFDSFYANMPQGLEMLFLFALAFGRHSSASLVHFAFLASLPLLMVSYGRRASIPNASVAAALFVFLCPVAAVTGTTAYNDIAAATVVFAVFHLMQIWVAEQRTNLLITAGLLSGFGYSIKYTAGIAILYALGVVIWTKRRQVARSPAPQAVLCLCAGALILPWTIKSWIWAGNPVTPFANRWFPNPNVHISFEDDYRHNLQRYDLKNWREYPAELMIHGVTLGGILGPLFFAAPIAIFAFGQPVGRRVLLAGLVFLLPYAGNIGTRFLLPALPFISLAMALALERVPKLLAGIVIVNAVMCWPSVVGYYSTPGIWRITGVPFRAALRLEPEDTFLSRESQEYAVARMIDQSVPPGKRVFAFSTVARAYTQREVLASQESGQGEATRDLLWIAIVKDWHPTRNLEFRFHPRTILKLRLVQTAVTGVMWSIYELRVFANGTEKPRSSSWRLTAKPNSWDVPMAFDNSPITRWRSWQKATPGMYVEIDFGRPVTVDAVEVQCAPDQDDTKERIDGMQPNGEAWVTLADKAKDTVVPVSVNLRAEGTRELKRRGFDYLLTGPDDFGAADFHDNASAWNLKLVGERSGSRLYEIDH